MTWNVSGLYERLYSWVTDRDGAVPIDAPKMDAEFDGLVSALNDVVQQNEPFQGALLAQDGAIGAPGYTFDSDTDTGIYRVSANTAALVTASTALLTWGASGVTIPTLTATTATITSADINGGTIDGVTIDGVTIGGASAGAGTFTNITATGTVTLTGATVVDLGAVTTVDINGGTIDGAVIGGASAAAATVTNLTATGTVTLTGATVTDGGAVTTIDINGGTIDGVTIGGASAGAITGTTVDGTTITASTGFSGPGTSISSLDADSLSTGTVPAARLSEATAANIRAGAANVLMTPANVEAAVEEVTLTSSSNSVAVDWSSFINGVVTLDESTTFAAPSNAEPGTTRIIRVVQGSTGGTIGFNAVYLFPGGVAPTASTGTGAKDTLYIYCETTSLFHVTHQLGFS